MKADPLDRRKQKTRSALHAAFIELLLEQGYDTLKIGDVADRANVGRSTFYEHYRSKQALLRDSISAPFAILAKLVDPAVTTDRTTDRVADLLRHFREQQHVARVLLGWPTRQLLSHALADLILLRLAPLNRGEPLIPFEVIAKKIADSQLALLEMWVLGRPACERDAAAEALKRGTGALVSALAGGTLIAVK